MSLHFRAPFTVSHVHVMVDLFSVLIGNGCWSFECHQLSSICSRWPGTDWTDPQYASGKTQGYY